MVRTMLRAPLIGICGPIGAGKSTVVSRLAPALGFHGWPERVEENPFFTRFVRDRSRWALRSQLAFMVGAVEDAAEARDHPPGGVIERPVQEMFGVFVDDLYLDGLLDEDERHILERIVALGERLAGVPDLLVVLHADPPRLLERVRARARRGEDAYTLPDMVRLDAAYRRWREDWNRSPVIDVDVIERDLRRADEIERLAAASRDALRLPR
jgi:deoxyadenosine/deoxycytidine kinase